MNRGSKRSAGGKPPVSKRIKQGAMPWDIWWNQIKAQITKVHATN